MLHIWSRLQLPNYQEVVEPVSEHVAADIFRLNLNSHFFSLTQYRGWTILTARSLEKEPVFVGRAREGLYDGPMEFMRAHPDPDQEWLGDPTTTREDMLAAFRGFVDKRQPPVQLDGRGPAYAEGTTVSGH